MFSITNNRSMPQLESLVNRLIAPENTTVQTSEVRPDGEIIANNLRTRLRENQPRSLNPGKSGATSCINILDANQKIPNGPSFSPYDWQPESQRARVSCSKVFDRLRFAHPDDKKRLWCDIADRYLKINKGPSLTATGPYRADLSTLEGKRLADAMIHSTLRPDLMIPELVAAGASPFQAYCYWLKEHQQVFRQEGHENLKVADFSLDQIQKLILAFHADRLGIHSIPINDLSQLQTAIKRQQRSSPTKRINSGRFVTGSIVNGNGKTSSSNFDIVSRLTTWERLESNLAKLSGIGAGALRIPYGKLNEAQLDHCRLVSPVNLRVSEHGVTLWLRRPEEKISYYSSMPSTNGNEVWKNCHYLMEPICLDLTDGLINDNASLYEKDYPHLKGLLEPLSRMENPIEWQPLTDLTNHYGQFWV